MEKKSIRDVAKTLIGLLDGSEKVKSSEFSSVSDCILGSAVMKAAMDELNSNFLECFETLNTMACEGLLVRGTHYDTAVDTDGDFVLRLNYRSFYKDFINYCREHNVNHAIFTLREFSILIRSVPYCKCHSWPVWFNMSGESYVNRKSFRSAVFYVYKLKDLGVDISNLIEE